MFVEHDAADIPSCLLSSFSRYRMSFQYIKLLLNFFRGRQVFLLLRLQTKGFRLSRAASKIFLVLFLPAIVATQNGHLLDAYERNCVGREAQSKRWNQQKKVYWNARSNSSISVVTPLALYFSILPADQVLYYLDSAWYFSHKMNGNWAIR